MTGVQTCALPIWQGRALTTDGSSFGARAAPVGSAVAYLRKTPAGLEVHVADTVTPADRVLATVGDLARFGGLKEELPHWSADGKYLYLLTEKGVVRVSAFGGLPQPFSFPLETDYGFSFDVSRNGKKIFFTKQASYVQPWLYDRLE